MCQVPCANTIFRQLNSKTDSPHSLYPRLSSPVKIERRWSLSSMVPSLLFSSLLHQSLVMRLFPCLPLIHSAPSLSFQLCCYCPFHLTPLLPPLAVCPHTPICPRRPLLQLISRYRSPERALVRYLTLSFMPPFPLASLLCLPGSIPSSNSEA